MPELKGQMDIFDVIKDEVSSEPTAARAVKVLDAAKANGWVENTHASLVLRLTREDALPFFASWNLSFNPETGKRSWRFTGARAKNMQPLNYQDIFVYLENPEVIYPEPPTGDGETESSNDCAA
jgi:hypothetical protein